MGDEHRADDAHEKSSVQLDIDDEELRLHIHRRHLRVQFVFRQGFGPDAEHCRYHCNL